MANMDPRLERLLKKEDASKEAKDVKVFVKLRRSGDDRMLAQFREQAAATGFRELDCVGEIVVGEIPKSDIGKLGNLSAVDGVEQSATYRMTGNDDAGATESESN